MKACVVDMIVLTVSLVVCVVSTMGINIDHIMFTLAHQNSFVYIDQIVCVHVCVCVYMCVYMCTSMCMHITTGCMCACVCTCIHMRVYVCVCLCVYLLCVYVSQCVS